MAGRLRALRWWIVGAVGAVVVLAVGAPFVYIHFVEGPAPPKLQLPKSTPSSPGAAAASPVNGVWHVGAGSIVGYRVQEVLIGQQSTAVGRTAEVWGSLTISGTAVETGSFTVDMASVVSDQSERNAQFDGRIMDVSTYPTAVFTLGSPISLAPVPAVGTIEHYPASGRLAMHGVTRQVSFSVSAERLGSGIDVLADIPVVFADWNIANPSVGGFVTTQSSGTLEVLLDLTRGPGNQPSSGVPSSQNLGGGGPVTVPSTTVPPLTVPSS